MAYVHALTNHISGLGPVSETTFYTQWHLSRRVLFPRMCVHKEVDTRDWYPKDTVEPLDSSSPWDTNDSGFISDLDFSPSGRLLVASCSSNTLFVMDPNRSPLRYVGVMDKPHKHSISKVRFVGDHQFVSGSADGSVGYWDLRKPSEPLNFLHLHRQQIRSLHYFAEKEYLVSSCQEGVVRFWHLPSFSVKKNEQDGDPNTQGVLFRCANLKHCYFSELQNLAVFSNNSQTIFVIQNLNIDHLAQDLSSMVFDDGLNLQLCWIKPNALPGRRNRVRILDNAEYSPLQTASVTNLSHLSICGSTLTLMRLTTSVPMSPAKEWTCACSLKDETTDSTNVLEEYINTFGSNVVNGTLQYAREETQYSSLREKHPSLSKCGRIIASPDRYGIQLYKFSPDMDVPSFPKGNSSSNGMDIFLEPTDVCPTPTSLEVVKRIPAPEKSVLCCKFSPSDPALLAVGDSNAEVKFISPQL